MYITKQGQTHGKHLHRSGQAFSVGRTKPLGEQAKANLAKSKGQVVLEDDYGIRSQIYPILFVVTLTLIKLRSYDFTAYPLMA